MALLNAFLSAACFIESGSWFQESPIIFMLVLCDMPGFGQVQFYSSLTNNLVCRPRQAGASVGGEGERRCVRVLCDLPGRGRVHSHPHCRQQEERHSAPPRYTVFHHQGGSPEPRLGTLSGNGQGCGFALI
jgi:hypothetical protein